MEESTCFFWKTYDADPVGALRRARDGYVVKPQVNERGDQYIRESCRCARGGMCCHSAFRNRANHKLLEVESAEA